MAGSTLLENSESSIAVIAIITPEEIAALGLS